MGLLNRLFGQKTPPAAPLEQLSDKLVELVLSMLREKDGRIRAEDAISAAATILAEQCISAVGEFDPSNHTFTPGSRVFSERMNGLLCADVPDIRSAPPESVFGMLRDSLGTSVYSLSDFPPLEDIFRSFVSRIGNEADWGKVPLSVDAGHFPHTIPLQVGFESRPHVQAVFAPISSDSQMRLKVSAHALAKILNMVASVIDHKVAVTIALETINGMAKTAPMTPAAFNAVQKQS